MSTFIIAEAGINHDGDLQRAKDLAYAAKEAGASAVKFQSYTAEKRVSEDNPTFDILKRCELSFGEQADLMHYCDTIEIEFFSTPFDGDQLEFLINDKGIKRISLDSLTLNKNSGPAASFSASLQEFRSMVAAVKQYEEFLGDGKLKLSEIEKVTSTFRRSS